MTALVNANPVVFDRVSGLETARSPDDARKQFLDDDERDPIDALEVYELLRDIKDPEHPNTLEQLRVVEPKLIRVDDDRSRIFVQFTPTVPHCSMTTLIGLCIRVKLMRCLPRRFKIDVKLTPGSHDQEVQVNKQLSDKERVAAALENPGLLDVVGSCLGAFS
jgi:metal-sulfur cluster biosynthetic enzyme